MLEFLIRAAILLLPFWLALLVFVLLLGGVFELLAPSIRSMLLRCIAPAVVAALAASALAFIPILSIIVIVANGFAIGLVAAIACFVTFEASIDDAKLLLPFAAALAVWLGLTLFLTAMLVQAIAA